MFPAQPPLGHHIYSYYLSDFDALGNGDESGIQVFHHNYNSLAPGSHPSIGIHDTQAVRQAGSITPFQGLCHHMHVATQKYGLCSGMYELGWKSLYFLVLYHFDSLVEVRQAHDLVHSHSTSDRKFCSTACQQEGHSQPIQGSQWLIFFTLLDHVHDLIDGQCAQSNWHLWSKGSWICYD